MFHRWVCSLQEIPSEIRELQASVTPPCGLGWVLLGGPLKQGIDVSSQQRHAVLKVWGGAPQALREQHDSVMTSWGQTLPRITREEISNVADALLSGSQEGMLLRYVLDKGLHKSLHVAWVGDDSPPEGAVQVEIPESLGKVPHGYLFFHGEPGTPHASKNAFGKWVSRTLDRVFPGRGLTLTSLARSCKIQKENVSLH